MAKVLYRQGTKATYLGLVTRDPDALYFCTDTKELFRGDDLYSDGMRLVASYEALPSFAFAADGILYFCKDNGCGYVMNESRDEWLPVVHGIDNVTIGLNDNGLLSVKSVPIETVSGLDEKLTEIEEHIVEVGNSLEPSEEFIVSEDGILSIKAIEPVKIVGLETRLQKIEQSIVGGVRYCGAVDKFEDLPTDASVGHLYEVYADNSEWCWNGEKWFEYGKTVNVPSMSSIVEEIRSVVRSANYEVTNKPVGTLVSYTDDEIRIMMPADMQYSQQNVGPTGDASKYYIGFRAYAPSDDVVSFKEDMAQVISDNTMYYFENNDFAGVDSYGRKYSIVWLAVAAYDVASGTWSYYGDKSTTQKYIGWDYSVEWFNADGIKVAADTIRINLANENCYTTINPHYVSKLEAQIAELEQGYTWGDM